MKEINGFFVSLLSCRRKHLHQNEFKHKGIHFQCVAQGFSHMTPIDVYGK